MNEKELSPGLEALVDQLMNDPVSFKLRNGLGLLIDQGIEFGHLRGLIRRIYDLNESQLYDISNANSGTLGKLNKKDTEARMKLYTRKVNKQKPEKTYYRIYAEGDSWFQFPRFIKDVIDWLNDRDDFLIISDAYGGDWITNILYEEQYVTGLTTYTPEFFLISGGGNDLVGNHRLGVMVDKNSNYDTVKYKSAEDIKSEVLSDAQKSMILNAQRHLNKEFYALIAVFELQYTLLFNKLYKSNNKHQNIISITQGYDYPIPDNNRRFSVRTPLQPLVNAFLDNGNWLYTPIMFTMIYEFNEMLASFAHKYDKVYHVDNRGLARDKNDWFDELHYKSHIYRSVADTYDQIIRNAKQGRVKKIVRSSEIKRQ
jgi:hypothetical protein